MKEIIKIIAEKKSENDEEIAVSLTTKYEGQVIILIDNMSHIIADFCNDVVKDTNVAPFEIYKMVTFNALMKLK